MKRTDVFGTQGRLGNEKQDVKRKEGFEKKELKT